MVSLLSASLCVISSIIVYAATQVIRTRMAHPFFPLFVLF